MSEWISVDQKKPRNGQKVDISIIDHRKRASVFGWLYIGRYPEVIYDADKDDFYYVRTKRNILKAYFIPEYFIEPKKVYIGTMYGIVATHWTPIPDLPHIPKEE